MSAARKRRVLRDWAAFLKSGFAEGRFTKALYGHLTSHCSFIAHFDRAGFFATYFADPSATQRFLGQFDRSKGCRSTEYGDAGWINGEEYRDVNAAMVDEASARLPALRRLARGREIAQARQQVAHGEASLARLLVEAAKEGED
jgi:hypothetical protein